MRPDDNTQPAPKVFQPEAAPPMFPTSPTVKSVLDWYEQNLLTRYSPTALQERRRQWAMFRKHCGSLLVEDARGADLLEFLSEQKGVKSNETRRRIKASINRPFNVAAATGLIGRNPFAGVKIPRGKRGRDWTREEYQAAMHCAPPHFRRVMVFIKFSGARPGEVRNLEWDQVRTEVGAIIMEDHQSATPAMARAASSLTSSWSNCWRGLRTKKNEKFVFTNIRGKPWTIGSVVKHMRSLRRRAKLKLDVTAHGIRHMFATGAIMAGVDIATLAQLVGHRALRTTARYVHLCDKADHLNAAMVKAVQREPKKGGQP